LEPGLRRCHTRQRRRTGERRFQEISAVEHIF
jgi:hypothetical protein